jgi:riboflavin synthase
MQKLILAIFLGLTGYNFAQNVRLDWAKSAGNIPLQDYSYGLSVDDSGNVYTTGSYALTCDFNPGVGIANRTAVGGGDIYVHKLDNSGNFKWVKSIGGISTDTGADIKTDSLGNVYVTGYFNGTADFDPGIGVLNLTSNGLEDAFIIKLDFLGNLIWAKLFGGTQDDGGVALAFDTELNVYITGYFNGTTDFDPGVGVMNITSSGDRDIFVQKLDSDGNFVWIKTAGGTLSDSPGGIDVDLTNNVYVSGNFSGTSNFNPEGVAVNRISLGDFDAFVMKLHEGGDLAWVRTFGSTFREIGRDICLDELNNVLITGRFSLTVDFDPGPSIYNLTHNGNFDAYLLKLNSDGNFIWAKSFGGSDEDIGHVVRSDSENNLYLAGYFDLAVDFDPGPESLVLEAVGSEDIYCVKINSLGDLIWVKTFGGTLIENVFGLDVDSDLNVYLSGFFEGVGDFDPGYDTLELDAGGSNFDFYVLKMAPCTPDETTDTIVACNSYTWIDGIEYFESTTTPIFVMSDTSRCDSIVSLYLTILPSVSATDVIEACDSYTWINGIEYTEDNDVATFTLTNEFGCDSVVTLNLTILSSSSGTDVQTACDSLLWTDGIMYYADNFTATDTFINAAGCDSIVTLNLTINHSNTGTDAQIACDSFVWIDGITYYEDNDEATFTLANEVGCDSVVTLNLVVNYSSAGTDEKTACQSYEWIDGIEYFEDNTSATFNLINSVGCDSVVTLNLDIIEVNLEVSNDDPVLTAIETDAAYQWLDCLNAYSEIVGANEESYIPENDGEYAVEISKLGCVDTSDCYTIETASLLKSQEKNTIILYPNPNNGLFNINLGAVQATLIQISSANGTIIYSNSTNLAGIHQIALNISAGLYFVDVWTESGTYQMKLVVEE